MTDIANLPAYKVRSLLDSLGYLDAFDVTGVLTASCQAPTFQIGYPDETRNSVNKDAGIIAVQQYGANGTQVYHHDVNMYIHLWTPTNGSQTYLYYMARMNEIMAGLKETWRDSDSDVQLISNDFLEGGQTDSGRLTYYASIRVICDL